MTLEGIKEDSFIRVRPYYVLHFFKTSDLGELCVC